MTLPRMKIHQSVALRRADDDAGCSQRCRDIYDRFRRRWTDRITKKRRLIRRPCFLLRKKSRCASGSSCHLRFAVLLGHEGLFADEEQIKPAAGLARFAQSEIERAPGAANSAEHRFGAWLRRIAAGGVARLASRAGGPELSTASFFIRRSCTSPRKIKPMARMVMAK